MLSVVVRPLFISLVVLTCNRDVLLYALEDQLK